MRHHFLESKHGLPGKDLETDPRRIVKAKIGNLDLCFGGSWFPLLLRSSPCNC